MSTRVLQSNIWRDFFNAMAESWNNLKYTTACSSFLVCKNRSRSALVRELLSNTGNFTVCRSVESRWISRASNSWFDLLYKWPSRQWIIAQQFIARADLFLKQNNTKSYNKTVIDFNFHWHIGFISPNKRYSQRSSALVNITFSGWQMSHKSLCQPHWSQYLYNIETLFSWYI